MSPRVVVRLAAWHPDFLPLWRLLFGPPPPPRPPPKSPFMKALLQFSERFGSMLSRLLLTLLYYVLLGPFALVYQLFADPLHLKRRPQGNWTAWVPHNDTLAEARRQD